MLLAWVQELAKLSVAAHQPPDPVTRAAPCHRVSSRPALRLSQAPPRTPPWPLAQAPPLALASPDTPLPTSSFSPVALVGQCNLVSDRLGGPSSCASSLPCRCPGNLAFIPHLLMHSLVSQSLITSIFVTSCLTQCPSLPAQGLRCSSTYSLCPHSVFRETRLPTAHAVVNLEQGV